MRGVLFALSALFLIGCDSGEPNIVRDAKAAVQDRLTDPASAQFKSVFECAGKKGMASGEVNAKNKFGGYTGFRMFYYHSGQAFILGELPFIGDDEKDTNYFLHLNNVCLRGGDPDFEKFYGYDSIEASGSTSSNSARP